MKEQILKLREEGKTYNQIVEILHCSKSLISYYCNDNTKEVMKRSKNNRKNGVFTSINKNKLCCLNCGDEIKKAGKKFCSLECKGLHKSISKYVEYLNNQEDYNGYKTKMSWIKQHILKEQDNRCDICKIENVWNNKPLIFILDHINGDACDNTRINLRLVCSNCDSQLDTYKAKNIGKSTRVYKPYIV